jgi:hypothetical protein
MSAAGVEIARLLIAAARTDDAVAADLAAVIKADSHSSPDPHRPPDPHASPDTLTASAPALTSLELLIVDAIAGRVVTRHDPPRMGRPCRFSRWPTAWAATIRRFGGRFVAVTSRGATSRCHPDRGARLRRAASRRGSGTRLGTRQGPPAARRAGAGQRRLQGDQESQDSHRRPSDPARRRPRGVAAGSGRPAQDALVFPTSKGTAWADHDYNNWRRRVFAPTVARAGLRGADPYDLRHAFCSLLIREGRETTEIARQAGHAPSMTWDAYSHVMEEMRGAERVPVEVAIRAVRSAHVSEKCPSGDLATTVWATERGQTSCKSA